MAGLPFTIVPRNPVACAPLLVRVGDELRAVVVVKATFSLAHERSAWPVAPDPIVAVDEHVAGHPTNPLLAASDLAPSLPGAGVVLRATAHAPGGRPVPEMAVRVAVFQDGGAVLNKHLQVVGDRKRGGEPSPFTRMPLGYQRAFGGPAVPTNPAGVGAGSGAQPNVIDPRRPDQPAGFGPIAATWAPRAAAMRRLAVPAGADGVAAFPSKTSFEPFHAAPVDQRIGALRGDEWIVLDGLNPGRPRVQTQLPFARALARYERRAGEGLSEIALTGDTLLVDTDRLTASVVWRGHVVVRSPEEARALVVFAALDVPTVSIDWPAPRAERPAPTPEWPDAIPDTTTERDVTAIRAAIAAQWGQASDLDHTAAIDERAASNAPLPFRAAPAPAPVDAATPAKPRLRMTAASTGTVDVDQALLRRALLPFAKSDAVDVKARAEERARAGGSLAGLPLAGADLTAANLAGADLEGLDLAGATLSSAWLAGAKLARADLSGAALGRATFDGADLTGAKLDRAVASAASFRMADLTGASFVDAELAGARFDGARLEGARLCRSNAEGAWFAGADCRGADLAALDASDADFRGADLRGADLRGANLDGADLRDADVAGAKIDHAAARGPEP